MDNNRIKIIDEKVNREIISISKDDELFFRGEFIGKHPHLYKTVNSLILKAKAWEDLKRLISREI